MSRQRLFTDEQCSVLAAWFQALRSAGTVESKAKQLECSEKTLRDAIARGLGNDTEAMRRKLVGAA